jgi:hypothetical protein
MTLLWDTLKHIHSEFTTLAMLRHPYVVIHCSDLISRDLTRATWADAEGGADQTKVEPAQSSLAPQAASGYGVVGVIRDLIFERFGTCFLWLTILY